MANEFFPKTDPAIAALLHKQLTGETLSAEELLLLEEWKREATLNQALAEKMNSRSAVQEMMKTWHNIEQQRELNKFRVMSLITQPKVHIMQRRTWRYAAAAALLIAAGTYLWMNRQQPAKQATIPQAGDIQPGHSGAILTLADGSTVSLDSAGNCVVASQSGEPVVLKNGQLTYSNKAQSTSAPTYNTISTPKGRQFRLLLPDGTQVWLNAASAIKYPTTFSGKERHVILEGEAYFEVAKNSAQPFKVTVDNTTEVEVLGTSFNINSYKNESAIRTTLLNGAVRVSAYQQTQTLQPGQQGVIKEQQLKILHHVDLDKVMAWKNGLFDFDDATLEEVMHQLERWYDIEVTYAKGVPAIRFGGEINKQNTLQDVLHILEKSNVHFRLEQGRKLVVMP